MINRVFALLILPMVFLFLEGECQYIEPRISPGDPGLPSWVKLMYAENPNIYLVDSAYQVYYRANPFRENSFTRYYMRWKMSVSRYRDDQGFVRLPQPSEIQLQQEAILRAHKNSSSKQGSPWTFAGPSMHYRARYAAADPVLPLSEQANIYCIEQSKSNTGLLYCGTESGGVYKSTDKGMNWTLVSRGLLIYDVSAITINPVNENEVLFGAAGFIYKTVDGGITWNKTGDANFQNNSIHPWQIEYNPANPQVIYAACGEGFYRTADGGTNWTQILPNESMSVAIKPNDPNTIYALQYNTTTKSPQFFKSVNAGQSFTVRTTGWFVVPAADLGKIESRGGRIAVTQANPNRVYVLLVGNSDASANLQLGGYIGVYSSSNSGESWMLPQQLIGMPYDVTTHPNLMDFDGHTSDYNQIYYNTALIASQVNENNLLIGGLNLWRSNDGAATYQAVGGYIGTIPYLHVDIQELKVYKTAASAEEVWIASDGGVNYSTDFVNTHESRCKGLWSGAFWGFDQGWTEDIRVGGRYHNGNAAYFQDYPSGEFIALGGGEAPTGYVNYSDERKTYFSDIDGRILPKNHDSLVTGFAMYTDPNESYWENSSSRIVFDWHFWNVAYTGKDNQLLRSTDGGSSFMPVYSFTANPANKVLWIEQSFSNPEIMYVQVVVNNISRILRTSDGGTTWTQINLPLTGKRELCFTLGYDNPDELWISFEYGNNDQKVYHTLNGGAAWTNLTTSALDNANIKAIACQAGTNGMVYIAARNGMAWCRNNAMSEWEPMLDGLPLGIDPLRLVPFYRDGKLRMGTWNMAIWETDLRDTSVLMANFSANYASFYCPGDTISFVNHSVCSGNTSCHWLFPGGTPSSSTVYNPKVRYMQPGTYDVTLIITDGNHADTVTRAGFIYASATGELPLAEGFESGALPSGWKLHDDGNDGTNWAVTNKAGGYGGSTNSILFDNFDFDVQGRQDEFWSAKLDFSQIFEARAIFDVAYAVYGGQYSDTLAVLATSDCGQTCREFYRKGGEVLATAPDLQSQMFVPAAGEWRTDTIEITGLSAQPEVILMFRNLGHFGQSIFVDNIRVETVYPVGMNRSKVQTEISIFPNPSTGYFSVRLFNLKNVPCNLIILDAAGIVVVNTRVIPETDSFTRDFDLNTYGKGVYLLKVKSENGVFAKKIIIY
ncbi:MAG: T9SS type A sorting domain-containing protein [Bacteroidetes bacterium]|nr:T9SS type A sorting domain-containing protein [Bacteroidota bacterium]